MVEWVPGGAPGAWPWARVALAWGAGAGGRSALILMVGKKWEIDEEGILCLIQSSSGSVSSPARARALRQDPS